ncbi:hypothetical protein CEXT_315981 [Caerostris extrusa]|uniref:Uncharacterized protein n=1 Tax=Caerostris extrusa TaxID=172846 RepID=A0AAV4SBE6_CAEEX|nr:hypothetical protein CEXT_315981 [Caerostris extrusa]
MRTNRNRINGFFYVLKILQQSFVQFKGVVCVSFSHGLAMTEQCFATFIPDKKKKFLTKSANSQRVSPHPFLTVANELSFHQISQTKDYSPFRPLPMLLRVSAIVPLLLLLFLESAIVNMLSLNIAYEFGNAYINHCTIFSFAAFYILHCSVIANSLSMRKKHRGHAFKLYKNFAAKF